MTHLISYDIENNKNRTKLFEELKDLGLLSIQKSVFYGELSKSEVKSVQKLFKKYCEGYDKAVLVACKLDASKCFGYEQDDFLQPEFELV